MTRNPYGEGEKSKMAVGLIILLKLLTTKSKIRCGPLYFFFLWLYSPILGLGSFWLLDLGQSALLLGRVISLLQGFCVSTLGDCEDEKVGGMNDFGRGNQSTQRKPAPTSLCPPQIPLARPRHEPGLPRWKASD
jgi:hypothetical protein